MILDLKPLTPDIIAELALELHDLWQVKIDDEIYGPFETLSLKHYSFENPKALASAWVAKVESDEWIAFSEVKDFRPAHVPKEYPKNNIWVLDQGHKSGPFTHAEIEKKIEMGLFSRLHEHSLDEGYSWKRLSDSADFSPKFVSHNELPLSPLESSFQKARSEVLDELEEKTATPSLKENLASMVYFHQSRNQHNKLLVDEIPLETPTEFQIGQAMKWAAPATGAMALALVLMISGGMQESEVDPGVDIIATYRPKRSVASKPKTLVPAPSHSARRIPSSVPSYRNTRSAVTAPTEVYDNYPTHIETHRDDPVVEIDPRDSQPLELGNSDRRPVEEYSLVENQIPEADPNVDIQNDASLDATMSEVSQAPPQNDPEIMEQPIVEEASDF